jgi:hypothetical protein
MEYAIDHYDPSAEFVHIDELSKYDSAGDLLKQIIKTVYITGNVNDFEDSLDELCDIFDLKIPYSKPLIRGK